jgi:crossover junction endodeoxyribonuclease RuvC
MLRKRKNEMALVDPGTKVQPKVKPNPKKKKRPKAEQPSVDLKLYPKILAIDPATVATGWAVMSNDGLLLNYGLFTAKGKIHCRLLSLYHELNTIIDSEQPKLIAVEDQFFGKNVDTLKKLSWVRGVILLLAAQRDIPVYVLSNKTAKFVTANSGASKKEAVKAAVCARYSLPETLDENISDAIAIGKACIRSGGNDYD